MMEIWKDKVVLSLMQDTESNRNLLLNCPVERFEDVFIVCRVVVGREEDRVNSVIVDNRLMYAMYTDVKELFEMARNNTIRILPPTLRSMQEVLEGFGFFFSSDSEQVPMYIFGNKDNFLGAVNILYPDELRKAGDRIGNDFYILPSSIHETILVPAGVDICPRDLKQIVESVNVEEVGEADRLSDSVYIYTRENGKVRRIL